MMSIEPRVAGLSHLTASFSTSTSSSSAASSPFNSPRHFSISAGPSSPTLTSASAGSSPTSASSSSFLGFAGSRKRRTRPQSIETNPIDVLARHAEAAAAAEGDDGSEDAQPAISRQPGGKRVKAAAVKRPSPLRKQQHGFSLTVQPTESSSSVRMSTSSAFSFFVSSSTSSLATATAESSSGPSSAAVASFAPSISSAFTTRSLSVVSTTSSSTTLTIHSPSSSTLPAPTPSSALASSLSSFTFSSSSASPSALPSTLECSEDLDDSKSATPQDDDDYVLVDSKSKQAESTSSSAIDEDAENEEEFEDEEADEDVEYDEESEGHADDECEEPLSDDDTVDASAASPATTSSLATSIATSGPSSSSSSASNPSPCPLPSALITSYYTPDPRAYLLSLSRSTDTLTTPASILEPLDPDLLAHMFDAEQLYHPLGSYMAHQPHLEAGMRPVLLDWMVEVSQEFGLQRETTQLAANFVDRFSDCLSCCAVSITQLIRCCYPHCFLSRRRRHSLRSPLHPLLLSRQLSLCLSLVTTSSCSVSPPCSSPPSSKRSIHPPPTTSPPPPTAPTAPHTSPPWNDSCSTSWHGAYRPSQPFAWCKALIKCTCRTVAHYFDEEVKRVEGAMGGGGAAAAEELERLDERLAELEVLKGECVSYLLSVDLFTRCMEFVDATLLDTRFLSFYPSALASAALLLVYSSPPAPVCLDLLLATTTYSLSSLLPAINMLSVYSGMEWRGVVKARSYFTANECKERVDERWSRQTHWDGMLEWKDRVERDEREREQHSFKHHGGGKEELEGGSELEEEEDEESENEEGGGCGGQGGRKGGGGRGGGGGSDVGESSLSSYGASGVALTSSLASTSEWSTLDSDVDRRD